MPPFSFPDPEPVDAWLVRAGEEEVTHGRLSLEGGDLVLRAAGVERARVRLETVHRVRRTRGSPVLVLSTEFGVRLLYFIEPPELSLGGRTPRPRGWDRLGGDRGLARTAGLWRLRAAGKALRPVLEGWEGAIRAQAGSMATNLRPREE